MEKFISSNEEKAKKFLQYVGDNYSQLMSKMEAYCNANSLQFDEDIFANTYLKVYEKIAKDGINDETETGMLNYFFKSFKTNTLREKMYARNQKRDANVDNDKLLQMFEDWYNDTNISEFDKLKSDLYKDFAAVFICKLVEEQFDVEHYNLFTKKIFGGLTYKQLAEKTKAKGVRTKVLEVKNWLKNNVTKAQIKDAFFANFAEIIC